MGNKTTEINCLELVIKEFNKQKGISKSIIKLLCGEEIVRKVDERPDFLKYYKAHNSDEKNTIIGIEHFRIDHFSKELKGNRIGSFGIGYEKKIKKAAEEWVVQIKECNDIPERMLVDMGSLIKENLELHLQSTYNAFIETFKYTLNKHIQSIDDYYSVINEYAVNCDEKLAFLIEIHSNFKELFFHDKKGIHHNKNIVPMFEELVNILEKIDSHKVHYLILCFGEIIYNDDVKVIAVPTHNLRKQLLKRHLTIYDYVGEDIFLSGFQTPRLDMKTSEEHKIDGDNIRFKVCVNSREIMEERQLEMIIECYNYIKTLEQYNHCYATTFLIELFYFCFNEFYTFIADDCGNINIESLRLIKNENKIKIEEKLDEFKNKWNIIENSDI